MDAEDVVLGTIAAAGGEIEGRTYLQKVTYFVSELMGVPLGFGPHYYGPYSSTVASETDSQVAMGRLEETPVIYSPGRTGYKYKLTESGREYAAVIEQFSPAEFQRVASAVSRIIGTGADYNKLAYAAKLHHLLKAAGGSISFDTAKSEARRLGWEVSDADLTVALEILRQLDLAE